MIQFQPPHEFLNPCYSVLTQHRQNLVYWAIYWVTQAFHEFPTADLQNQVDGKWRGVWHGN